MMKQKLFAWGDDFFIKDENGKDVYFVDGRAFSFGKQLSFQDLSGNELLYIKQRLLSFSPAYEIYQDDELVSTVEKALFTFFSCKFTVDVAGPDDLEAEGDFMDHEYVFTRDGEMVAAVSKEWFSWSDTYGVDVAEGENDLLILASTVIIDMACHADKN